MITSPPLLALSDHPERADFHWRIGRPWQRLREAGADARHYWLGADELPTISPAGRVVVLQRVAARGKSESEVRAWVQRLRDAGALAVVYECDDDVLSPAYMAYLDACGGLDLVSRARLEAEHRALVWTMQACDGVTVSTEHLASVARRFTDRPIHVVPNAVDVPWFRARLARGRPHGRALTLGWAGGRRPEADLEPMALAWARIAQRYPAVRFVVAGWQPDVIYRELDGADAIDRIIRVPWADLDGYPLAYQVDIGCCPLAATPFNASKSPIKAYEYSLAGAVVVASPVVYGPCVAWGGLLAETADEWTDILAWLVEDEITRRQERRALVQHVEQRHSLAGQLDRWTETYSQTAETARVPA